MYVNLLATALQFYKHSGTENNGLEAANNPQSQPSKLYIFTIQVLFVRHLVCTTYVLHTQLFL